MNSKQEFQVSEWLNSESRASLKDAVSKKIFEEQRERLLRNYNSQIDYGYSFPGLNCVKQTCLKEIRAYYKEHGKRARVADIGAGFGSMTWKLLAAGAEVDAFEIQKPSADELLKRIKKINPYFWEEDDLQELLHVYAENALNRLKEAEFKDKYDFIWMSQVIHFLTPKELINLKSIFQQVLKPGGKVFMDANTYNSFRSMDKKLILLNAYESSKQKGLECPGFLAVNGATLIDNTVNEIVERTFVSVYDQTQLKQYSIPYQTNAYGMGYVGPTDELEVEKGFNCIKMQYPSHNFSVNHFHQVMTLLDEETAPLVFKQNGFKCVSYLFDNFTGKTLSRPIPSEAACLLAVCLEKASDILEPISDRNTISALLDHSIFNEEPHKKLILDLEQICTNKVVNQSFFEAIRDKEYGLALRKASAVANLDFVKILLKYQHRLDFDVNGQSKNGYTALDWINSNQKVEYITKERIISLLARHGVQSGLTENILKSCSS